MAGLIFGDPPESVAVTAQGLDAFQSSTGDVLSAAAGSAWHNSYTPRLYRAVKSEFTVDVHTDAADVPEVDGMGNATGGTTHIPASGPALLSPEEATKAHGIRGMLTFKAPMTDQAAAAIAQEHQDEVARQAIIARAPDSILAGATAQTVLGFATAALDPINIAASIVPVLGQARMASLLVNAGSAAGRAGVRAGVGGAQGALGMALLEPLNYALSQREHIDWTMAHALQDIAFGTVLGGGLHMGGGAIADAWTGKYRSPIGQLLENTSPELRHALLQGSVAAHVEGRPTNVAPLLDIAPPSYRKVTDGAGLGNYATFTPGGLRIEVRPEIVPADSLLVSHTDAGTVNPAYPHEAGMQPRDRTNASSQAQIADLAANLQPELLAPSPQAGAGAPIVSDGHVVESGNGRVMAIRRVYDDPNLVHRAAGYRAYLESQGHDLTGIDKPVLIGRRVTALTPEQQRDLARGGNERNTMALNATEQARGDASRAGSAIDQLHPGPIDSVRNGGFVQSFFAQLPASEAAGLRLSDGRLSPDGARRISGAVLAHAYGDALGTTLERMLSGDVAHFKGIAGALHDVAPVWGTLRAAAARGDIPANLDITPALGEAVQLLDRARAAGQPIGDFVAQGDMLGQNPTAVALLRLMFHDEAGRRPVAQDKIAELLRRYVGQAMEVKPGPDLFGGAPLGPGDLLHTVTDAAGRARAAQAIADIQGTAQIHPEDIAASREATAAAQQASIGIDPDPRAGVAGMRPDASARPAGVPAADDVNLARLPADQQAVLTRLYNRAAAEKPGFDRLISGIAAEAGGEAKLSGLKGTKRAVAKIEADYAGNASGIKDLLRATIVVDTPQQAAAAIRATSMQRVDGLLVPAKYTLYARVKHAVRNGEIDDPRSKCASFEIFDREVVDAQLERVIKSDIDGGLAAAEFRKGAYFSALTLFPLNELGAFRLMSKITGTIWGRWSGGYRSLVSSKLEHDIS